MTEFEELRNSSVSFQDETFVHPLGPLFPILKTVLSTTLISLLVIIMLAMGCVITWKEVYHHLRRPIGVVTGMLSQFVLLPLVGFGISHALKLSPYHAIGLLVLTCSPGGTTSNIFTYFTDGDVSLSIVMTTASTVLALGLMPLNLLLYTPSWTSDQLVVPYDKISLTLILILIPVIFGMLTRWKLPKVADKMSKTGSIAGLLAIVSTIVLQGVLYPTI
uniref:Uncharacterized protein n=1 Tax=Strigamia maritima TaxID=126957 RepID=T1JMM4_STRMM